MRLDPRPPLPRKRRNLKKDREIPQPGSVLPYLVREFLEANQQPYSPMPTRFVAELSERSVAADLAFNNFISVTVLKGASHRKIIEEIARCAQKPFTVGELSPVLDDRGTIRGKVCFNHVWKVIDDLAQNWEGMRWWMTQKGLSVQTFTPRELAIRIRLTELTPLEAMAGKLFVDRTVNGRVSTKDVAEIAKILDQNKLSLKDSLTREEWQLIVARNQKFSRRPIRSFEQAFREYPRIVRRVLYRARDRYSTATNS